MTMSRTIPLLAVAFGAIAPVAIAAEPAPRGPFSDRGYYITFMRMPTYDLADWRHVVDDIRDDGGNLLLLWVAGAFRSEKYPVTWRYNAEHENVRHDFVRELIAHAHARGIRVLLAFTPFGYDGVNQWPLAHPELKAVGKDGKPVAPFGIGCWGYNLCPAREGSQQFMLGYVREMYFQFYPEADGLMIEASDYAICHCSSCGEHYYDREFQFVRQISDEVWARKPGAMIVVYPHYFSGKGVPGFDVRAARQGFDSRWILFFTPHSANLDPSLIKQARHSLWWDDSPALRRPADVRAGARRARDAGVTGYVPSLEAFSFLATNAEEGQLWLRGRRQVPAGFGWLDQGKPPYDELPFRVQRIAYREFSRDPDLPFDKYREILGREVLGPASSPRAIDDLLELQAAFGTERTWCQPSPLVCPDRVRALRASGGLTEPKRAEYRAALDRLRDIAERHRKATSDGEKELLRITRWVLHQWQDPNRSLLANGQ
jgi:hypothetical protein